eukprot:CAMPEP_0181312168 /NCGR_PEP_ID=MMETSP1101-20121128/13543_1 /TAXON_ID=46948 /ORGANISM="Rhodomonas abbreviata, Strain Caron Lab Isolate" /LENGTH=390 /DNA_ID=CAMNT_0023418981 /DNA_START=121 /DNA_END=1293 /DNA_ORIENTATION=+
MPATVEFPFDVTLAPLAAAAAEFKSATLACGIPTMTRNYNASTVSVDIAVGGGSGTESAEQKGAAHMISTAAFAGDFGGVDLVRNLERMGATFGSRSDKEQIVYTLKVSPTHAEDAIAAVMQDVIAHAPEPYVYQENKAFTQVHYDKFAGNHSAQLHELVHEAAFGEESGLGSSMFAANLNKLGMGAVEAYRAAHFVRSNLSVAASGMSQERLAEVVQRCAETIPEGAAAKPTTCAYTGGSAQKRADMDGNSVLGLAFPVPAGAAAKPYAVLQALLGSKMSASTFMYTFGGSTGGLMGVEACGSAASASADLAAAVSELKAIAAKCPEIEGAKNKVALDSFLALEGDATAHALLSAHSRGVDATSAGDVRSVTAAEVSAAATAALKATPA